ncbi:hypothetical protein D0867_07358 [Hortaea werneckii]|uniref:Uncharacterized protein n=1 Tax=Hortaea werneckii TaxID=91943 RepID=A0A3M6ZF64_HORWE|nr:hypothetical protein D0867_07358 [Hortaea werneckii]
MSGFKKFVGKSISLLFNLSIFPHHPKLTFYAFNKDAILTSKYNKPFPVTLLPSAIGYWLGMKQGERQAQILNAIQAAGAEEEKRLERIVNQPK